MWAPIYGAILKLEFFQPLAALLGSTDGVDFFGSDNGTLVVSIIVIVLTSGLVALGMAGYARIQRWCLYAGLLGFAIMVVLMLVSSQADFQAAFDRAIVVAVRRDRRLRQDDRRCRRRTTRSPDRSIRWRWATTSATRSRRPSR